MDLDPVSTNPDAYRVLFENERVRVLEYTDTPGHRTTPHRHPDSVMVSLSSFRRRLGAHGREVEIPFGVARWVGGAGALRGEHRLDEHPHRVRRARGRRTAVRPREHPRPQLTRWRASRSTVDRTCVRMVGMRWDAQKLDLEEPAALPGLPTVRGLLRRVQVPEFPGLTFHEVRAKSALNAVPATSDMPFGYTINPYRGCSHACVYCFARSTHEWLEFDSGTDFDRQIVVKTNVAEVLRRELARASWRREHVALGTNTDPYQRAEGRYRLMPGIIDALAGSGTPFSILTKGTLARRDVPQLAAASRVVPIGMGVSMAIWDDDLHAALEPGVPTPRARLDLVRTITDAGLPCGVFLAPVLPGLTDRIDHLDSAIGAIAEAGATGVTVLPLHLRPGAREWFTAWLAREHPALVPRYRALYGRGAYVPAEYRSWLAGRVAPILARHGLDRHSGGTARRLTDPNGAPAGSDTGLPGDPSAGFPSGSLPDRTRDRAAQPAAQPEQLSLC
jgi:DNA repair photolyase